jgi:hypothetical protein
MFVYYFKFCLFVCLFFFFLAARIFQYSGFIVNFTVPSSVNLLNITAIGAQGGAQPTNGADSGFGAQVFGFHTLLSNPMLHN